MNLDLFVTRNSSLGLPRRAQTPLVRSRIGSILTDVFPALPLVRFGYGRITAPTHRRLCVRETEQVRDGQVQGSDPRTGPGWTSNIRSLTLLECSFGWMRPTGSWSW